MTREKSMNLTGGLARLGAHKLLVWGQQDPRSNVWRRWIIQSSTAVSHVLAFETFLHLRIFLTNYFAFDFPLQPRSLSS